MTPPRPTLPTVIAHVDMNTFFVSVERLTDPALEGLPVVVGGKPGQRSVVSAASYEARRFGIHSAMPMDRAVQLCPELVIVSPHFKDYKYYHGLIEALLKEFAPIVEMTSIDEGYLDLTGTQAILGTPSEAGLQIRARIWSATQLPASVGLSSNRVVSKIASDLAKPAGDPRLGQAAKHPHPNLASYRVGEGVICVPGGSERKFLAPLPVSYIPGCGPVTVERLRKAGLHTIGDIASQTEQQMDRQSEYDRHLWRRARGEGASRLVTQRQRKSISKEQTFAEDVDDLVHLRGVMHQQAESITASLRKQGVTARTVRMKLRYPGFETHTHSRTLPESTDHIEEVFDTAIQLFEQHRNPARPIRLIGVGVTELVHTESQGDLFTQTARETTARRERVVDELRERFGKGSVLTGESVNLLHRQKTPPPRLTD